jgi:undecaprenyl-diphosphatase
MAAESLLEFAVYAGANALTLFFALLVALLLLVTVIWWVSRDYVLPQVRLRWARVDLVLINGLVGFAVVIGAAVLFTAIADALVDTKGAMARVDVALTASLLSHVGATTRQVFAAVTHLGDPLVLTVLGVAIAVVLVFAGRYALALGWVLAVGGNALLNPALKRIFERIRPPHEIGLVNEASWSFPSGHTSGATVAYGMLAYIAVRTLPPAWQLPAVLAAAALAFTVGCSRIFLQVHFASDVAAGFASGTAWLAVCIVSVELSRRYSAGVRP